MTVAAPPKPPRHDEPQALNEQALIQEARMRTRRRRQGYALVALLGAVAAAVVGFARGGGHTPGAGSAPRRAAPAATRAVNGKIAFEGVNGALQVINPDGWRLKTLVRCGTAGCQSLEPAWSPDGTRIAFVRGASSDPYPYSKLSLYVTDQDGRHLRRLAGCGSCGAQWGARLGWSPDGKTIAFSRDAGPMGEQSLWVVSVAGGPPQRLSHCSPASCVDVDPVWSPVDRLIAFHRGTDGRGGSAGLYTIRPDGSNVTLVAGGNNPEWSPDGRRIAFDGDRGIGVVNVDGTRLRLLFAQVGGAGPGVPFWSPDGTKLAFFNTPGSPGHFRAEVWTMKPDGSARTRVYRSPCCIGIWAPPIFSPDGRLIAVSDDAVRGIYVIKSDGGGVHWISRAAARDLSWQRLVRH